MFRSPCPKDILPMSALDTELYKGTWREMYRVKGNSMETGKCVSAIYGDRDDGAISVWNMQWFGDKPNQTTKDIKGKAYCPDGVSGACKVKFNNFFIPEGNYNVIDTDYSGHAVVYSCAHTLGFIKFEFMWVLTRDALVIGSQGWTEMKDKVLAIVKDKFSTSKEGRAKFADTDDYLFAVEQGDDICQYELQSETATQ
mmetsp:Transcript_1165/g.2134  ORF Transcript_1165/g.2134 Transcript_1165/m.2134 type:complete len:198 (-) Transcript_1165:48-641(-)|eukprot:CAMPEP_0168612678 /NCGR_PEP_ID=MMETSP0449_2-20121227/3045_1 /TAXON_ID=1082188 /ORGANISM="Strombidium rassoulzadegani, Strain ras09" /LENGTH=197 /DNA_ID=CAMNT_0008653259 /DNA_START=154 /DNA_END=747 /DNA_ORIENTATION=-